MARTPVKKSTTGRPRKKAAAARRTAVPEVRPATARPAPATSSAPSSAGSGGAPAPGAVDLAGGLRMLLSAVETEVREVSALSETIDKLVTELNARRDDQTKRLLVLDALRGSADDQSLGAFLEKAIRPRKPRVTEVVPKRLEAF